MEVGSRRDIGAPSARPDEAFTWITAVAEGITELMFADSKFLGRRPIGFEMFDAKLSSALSRIVVRGSQQRVRRRQERHARCDENIEVSEIVCSDAACNGGRKIDGGAVYEVRASLGRRFMEGGFSFRYVVH